MLSEYGRGRKILRLFFFSFNEIILRGIILKIIVFKPRHLNRPISAPFYINCIHYHINVDKKIM